MGLLALITTLLAVLVLHADAQSDAAALLSELNSYGIAEATASTMHDKSAAAAARSTGDHRQFPSTAGAGSGPGSTHSSFTFATRSSARDEQNDREIPVMGRQGIPERFDRRDREAPKRAPPTLRDSSRRAYSTGTGKPSQLHPAMTRTARSEEKPMRSLDAVTAVELAEARQRLGLSSAHVARADESLLAVGGPPGPVTMAERWRLRSAQPNEDCWRTVRIGYLCVDDYSARAIVCNPHMSYRASARTCAQPVPRDRVDMEETIVRRLAAASFVGLPPRGRSDVYYARFFPAEPRAA